jgi:hypothetical protein
MAAGQETVLVVSIYVTYISHDGVNFSITNVNSKKMVMVCTIVYVLLNEMNKDILLERSVDFPSRNS